MARLATSLPRKNGSLHLSSYSLFRSGEQKRIQTFCLGCARQLSVFGGERRPVSIFSGHYIRRSYEALGTRSVLLKRRRGQGEERMDARYSLS